ncbi:MAG: YraN family protein [Alphaproteobacteria bacterium]
MIARNHNTPHPKRKLEAQKLGRIAEMQVLWHFRLRGWKILARNWRPRSARQGGGELDLVIKRRSSIVFIEIKARKNKENLETILSHAQQKRIKRAATEFLAQLETKNPANTANLSARFDLVCVFNHRLQHFQNIWQVDCGGDRGGGG